LYWNSAKCEKLRILGGVSPKYADYAGFPHKMRFFGAFYFTCYAEFSVYEKIEKVTFYPILDFVIGVGFVLV
jgi:hypothetical protein